MDQGSFDNMRELVTYLLQTNAAKLPHSPAIICDDRIITHLELQYYVQKTIQSFNKLGIPSDINIALRFYDPIKHLIYYVSLLQMEICQISINPRELIESQKKIISYADIDLIIQDLSCETLLLPQTLCLSNNLELSASSTEWKKIYPKDKGGQTEIFSNIIIGSGTTGDPKVFKLHSSALAHRITREADAMAYQSKERFFCHTRLYFAGPKNDMVGALYKGLTVIAPTEPPKNIINFCIKNKIDHLSLSSNEAVMMIEQEKAMPKNLSLRLPGIKTLSVMSSIITEALRKEILKNITENLYIQYGTNEFGDISLAVPKDIHLHPGTVGRAYPGVTINIIDDKGNLCKAGETGNIVVTSSDPMVSYINKPDLTQKTFTTQGYFPGDLGRLTKDGNLIFEGRKDDLMVVAGANIYPREIETVLESHPDILEAAAFPLHASYFQDYPVAVVSVINPVSSSELTILCTKKLGFKRPRQIYFTDRLPRNNAGKVLKKVLVQTILEKHRKLPSVTKEDFDNMKDLVTFLLGKNKNELPNKPAIISGNNTISHHELFEQVEKTTQYLSNLNLPQHIIIALRFQDPVKYLIFYFSLFKMQICQLALNPKNPIKIQEKIIDSANIGLIIQDLPLENTLSAVTISISSKRDSLVTEKFLTDINTLPRNTLPGMSAEINIGSGTTGVPKLYIISSHALAERLKREADVHPFSREERYYIFTEFYYRDPRNQIVLALLKGMTVLLPKSQPKCIITFCLENKIDHLELTGSQAIAMLGQSKKIKKSSTLLLPYLKSLMLTSSLITEAVREEVLKKITKQLYINYGTNEFGIITMASPQDIIQSPGTVGKAIPGVNLSIANDDGKLCTMGEIGNILIKSPNMNTFYINNPEATKKVFREGNYYPGDLGKITKDGNLIFEGRTDDMMIYQGANIYPREIESILEAHPYVIEAAAFPLYTNDQESIPFAVVSTSNSIKEIELLRWCALEMGWRGPRHIFFIKKLPRNSTGKVLKRVLAEKVVEFLANQQKR